MKHTILALIVIAMLIILTACGGNKQIAPEPVPVRNPIALAHEAAARGADAYDDKLYDDAIMEFSEAISLFEEAAPTAVPSDSINLNLEKMNLNIGKTYVDMAVASNNLKNYSEAITNYENALGIYKTIAPYHITQEELNGNILGVYNNMAIISRDANKYEDALKYYDLILEMQPNDPEILNTKFFILSENIKDDTRAYAVLIKYAEASNDPAAYINLAERYEERKNPVEAEKYYLKALTLKQDADMYRRMANFYRGNQNWKEANVNLEKLAATNPDPGELAKVYSMIGKNYDELNDKKKMVEYYEKSLAQDRDPMIALALASYYNGTKTWAKVISNATITLNADARNNDALMLRGVAYYQSKNYAAARVDLDKLQNDAKYGTQAKSLLKNMPKK